MLQVEVNVWPIQNAGNLLATVTAHISTEWGDIKISRIKVVRNKKGTFFLSLPQHSYEKDGAISYASIIELPHQILKEIEFQALKELEI